jgi:hypothetical protein
MSNRKRAALVAACAVLSFGSLVRAADPTPGDSDRPAAPLLSLDTPLYLDAATTAPATTTAATAPAPQPYGKKVNENFLQRLNEAFMEQSAAPAYTPPDPNAPPGPTRRIGPTPFDSPPYPDMDWQIGGGPQVIGDPGALRDSPFPLMQAIYDGPNGKAWYDSRVQFYGWVTVSGNISTSQSSKVSQTANFPEVYDERPNRVELDQTVLYIERMADMDQTDHIDWGFRVCFLYGLDYRFMASRGYLNDNTLFVENKFYGFDTPMTYFNVYIPGILQGEEIIVGRIISEPDIEQQLAPNNLMASHSLVYAFDDYTTWGIFTNTKIDKNWLLQVNLMCGVDIAPWEWMDPGCQPTGGVNLQYIDSGGHDTFYIGMNSFNNGKFGFNNLQECIESYTHKFNDVWWTTFEGQYMYTRGCSTVPTKQVPIEDGFYPTRDGFVWAGGIVNYTNCRVAPNAFLSIRNEVWDDPYGYRSGYSGCYYEGAVGGQWWPNKLTMVRPEIRYEHCFNQNRLESSSGAFNTTGAPSRFHGPYDNGTKLDQLTFAIDVTYHF